MTPSPRRIASIPWSAMSGVCFVVLLVAFSLSGSVVLAVADGSTCTNLFAAGYNQYGQFGSGAETLHDVHKIPSVVGMFDEGLVSVSTGVWHSAIVKPNGTAWTAGRGMTGRLGHGDEIDRPTFTKVENVSKVVKAVAAYSNSFFLTANGDVFATGDNRYGQLGIGDTTHRYGPVQVLINDVVDVAAGSGHALFLKSDGSVYVAGRNYEGQLCNGDINTLTSPANISALTDVVEIDAGWKHSILRKGDGSVWACGWNIYGQLGVSDNSDRNVPTQVSGIPTSVTGVATSKGTTAFLLTDGTALSTGSNFYGELGGGLPMGSDEFNRNVPGPVSIDGVKTIHGSRGDQFYFLKEDGTVWAAGKNLDWELGIGNASSQNVTVEVATLVGENVSSVVGGDLFTLFVGNSPCIKAPTSSPTDAPTTPTSVSSPMPSGVYSSTPSAIPSKMISPALSLQPSAMPSVRPTVEPSMSSSSLPSALQSVGPSLAPSTSGMPSQSVTNPPTTKPTAVPTEVPTGAPTSADGTSGVSLAHPLTMMHALVPCAIGMMLLAVGVR